MIKILIAIFIFTPWTLIVILVYGLYKKLRPRIRVGKYEMGATYNKSLKQYIFWFGLKWKEVKSKFFEIKLK